MIYRCLLPLLLAAVSLGVELFGGGTALANTKVPACAKLHVREHAVSGSVRVQKPETVRIHLKTTYADGISVERVIDGHVIAIDDVQSKYRGFHVRKCSGNEVFLNKRVDAPSPVTETAAIIGLESGRVLSLHNRTLRHRPIQTFFQIDVSALETNRAAALNKSFS